MQKRMLVWYLENVRKKKSPWLYWKFRESLTKGPLPDVWSTVRDSSKSQFERVLAEYDYKYDPLKGALDFSPQEKDWFFLPLTFGRDCDSWARMWYWWAEYHEHPAWEICMIDGIWNIPSAHFITVFQDSQGHNICNYTLRGHYNSLSSAMRQFRIGNPAATNRHWRNLVWSVYQNT